MILITGAVGFIGSATVWLLNERGRSDLVLVDSFGKDDRWSNLIGRNFHDFVHYDRLFEYLASLGETANCELVIHMGACTDTACTDMNHLYAYNTEYTRRLFLWARQRSARFIYASSAGVYGDGSLGFGDEDALTPKLRPLTAYAFSKWLFDNWLVQTKQTSSIVGLRLFNVYGPNEYHKGHMASVLCRAFKDAKAQWVMRLFKSHNSRYADGEQRRDFIYVKDVLQVLAFFLDHPEATGIFNVGTGEARSFNDCANALGKALRKPLKVEYFPMPQELRAGYQYQTQADISKLREAGFTGTFKPFYLAVGDYVHNYLVRNFAMLGTEVPVAEETDRPRGPGPVRRPRPVPRPDPTAAQPAPGGTTAPNRNAGSGPAAPPPAGR
ncbi:MAG: ADP-glyceromanno-heptose 6-epimerase [Kiritimatiellae bacterium]|nr:ADP-glyceromanno-heptose 6-epimerase [Kiritimatiellia bacterium]